MWRLILAATDAMAAATPASYPRAAVAGACLSSSSSSSAPSPSSSTSSGRGPHPSAAATPGKTNREKDAKTFEYLMKKETVLLGKLRDQFESKLKYKGSADTAWDEFSSFLDNTIDGMDGSITSHHFLFKSIASTPTPSRTDLETKSHALSLIVSKLGKHAHPAELVEVAKQLEKLGDLARLRALVHEFSGNPSDRWTTAATVVAPGSSLALPLPSGVWEALLRLSLTADPPAALQLFEDLRRSGRASLRAYTSVMAYYFQAQKFAAVVDLHAEARRDNLRGSPMTQVRGWGIAMSAMMNDDRPAMVVDLFPIARNDIPADVQIFNLYGILINALTRIHKEGAENNNSHVMGYFLSPDASDAAIANAVAQLYATDAVLRGQLMNSGDSHIWGMILSRLAKSRLHVRLFLDIYGDFIQSRKQQLGGAPLELKIDGILVSKTVGMCCRFADSYSGSAEVRSLFEYSRDLPAEVPRTDSSYNAKPAAGNQPFCGCPPLLELAVALLELISEGKFGNVKAQLPAMTTAVVYTLAKTLSAMSDANANTSREMPTSAAWIADQMGRLYAQIVQTVGFAAVAPQTHNHVALAYASIGSIADALHIAENLATLPDSGSNRDAHVLNCLEQIGRAVAAGGAFRGGAENRITREMEIDDALNRMCALFMGLANTSNGDVSATGVSEWTVPAATLATTATGASTALRTHRDEAAARAVIAVLASHEKAIAAAADLLSEHDKRAENGAFAKYNSRVNAVLQLCSAYARICCRTARSHQTRDVLVNIPADAAVVDAALLAVAAAMSAAGRADVVASAVLRVIRGDNLSSRAAAVEGSQDLPQAEALDMRASAAGLLALGRALGDAALARVVSGLEAGRSRRRELVVLRAVQASLRARERGEVVTVAVDASAAEQSHAHSLTQQGVLSVEDVQAVQAFVVGEGLVFRTGGTRG
ncbi:hypothetical protein HDU82_002691 [Entophlyctis luteolus]|nr:hypothetical protein HDU82_002691 [Entophlyctis luteolus]